MPVTAREVLVSLDEVLEQSNFDLLRLVKRTEDQFLSIGQNLRDSRSRARRISHLSSSASNALLEERAVDAVDSLHAVLERMKQRVQSSAEFGHIIDTLKSILKTLASIRNAQPEFRHVITTLRRLSLMTKVENANLDGIEQDFGAIALDIDELSKLIDTKANELMGAEMSLTGAINAALGGTHSLQAEERNIARSALVKTETNLGTLTQTGEQCSQMAETLAGDSDDVSKLIGTVVESVQMQDIAAQRIVGVTSVLEQLRSKVTELQESPDSSSPDDGALPDDFGAELFATCDKQISELGQVRDGLINAVHQIQDNLTRVSGNMAELVKKTRRMVGMADVAGRSFFGEMKDDFNVVRTTLRAGTDAEVRFNTTLSTVSTTGGDMAGLIDDIEDIRAEIEVIGLGARISSTRAGEQGAALFVIAASIQSLLEKTGDLTSSIASDLREVDSMATHLLHGFRTDQDGGDSELQKMLDDLSRCVETFREINDNIMGVLSEMEDAVTTLSQDVAQAVFEFTIDRVAPEIIDDITRKLGAIIRPLESKDPRPIQRSVATTPIPGTSSDTTVDRKPDVVDSPGLGANVELF